MRMPRHLFVTGTDTEVGKTQISIGFMRKLQQQGHRTAAMKPVASGCIWQQQQWQNDDALALIAQSDVKLDYAQVNPYAFEPAIAPHIAAEQAGVTVSLNTIKQQYDSINRQTDAVIVEGAGGWLVPLNETETMADLAIKLDLPVVLVVAIKLGCINHALLTVESIHRHGLKLAGWIANHTEHQSESAEIIDSLKARIEAPCLGVVPHLDSHQMATDIFIEWSD